MRARVYDGHRGRAVQLPEWVELTLPAAPTDAPTATCKRCGRSIGFSGPRQEDERALGRFAVWHRRCKDPELVRAAVEAAERVKADRAPPGLIRWVKRGR